MKQRYLARVVTLLAGGLGMSGSATALELAIHGSMAQGYALTEGNNSDGSSLDGSFDLYEVALNARTSFTPRLLASGQLMARRSGRADDGKLRVDFAQLDYQFWTGINGDFGTRIGKLKNPYGFYNDTRDVVFSRPGITMPSSVYFDTAGVRDVLFASEGVQAYGSFVGGANATEWTLGWGPDYDATDAFSRSTMENELLGEIRIKDFILAHVTQDMAAGRYRLGLSYLTADISLKPDDPASSPALSLHADLWVASLQMQGEHFVLTGEFRYSNSEFDTGFGVIQTKGDGAYLQYRRFVTPEFDWYLRYDTSFEDRNDRDGRERERTQGDPRHRAFSRDHAVGVSWRPTSNWGLFAEYHYIDGTSQVSTLENTGRVLDRYWQKTLLMLAYRF